jgi:hypothetical protein
MYTFLLEHCGDGTTLLGAYESRPAAEGMLRELPQDERYIVTEVPLNRRPGAGLADNMGSMNHWHYLGCAEDKGDVDGCAEDKGNAETGKPRLGDCYRDGVAYCLAYDANGRVELDGKTFTALDMGIDGGAAKALHRHMNPLPPGDLPHFVVALRLERVALRPGQVAGGTSLAPDAGTKTATRVEADAGELRDANLRAARSLLLKLRSDWNAAGPLPTDADVRRAARDIDVILEISAKAREECGARPNRISRDDSVS